MNAFAESDQLFGLQTLWDGQFRYVLQPPDILPGICSEEEIGLINDAHIVNHALEQQDRDFLEKLFSDDPVERRLAIQIDSGHQALIDSLFRKIDEAKLRVAEQADSLGFIGAKYLHADQAAKTLAMDDWVKARLAQFSGVQVASDVDKTITLNADYLKMIPGSVKAENYMAYPAHGRDMFAIAFVRYWRESTVKLAGNFYRIGTHVPFRPGVENFFQLTQDANIPAALVSANFAPLVDGVKHRLNYKNIYRTTAVEYNDLRALDKATILAELVLENPTRALAYFGDGDSDFPALEEGIRQFVAVYFALKGASFEQKLRKLNLPYYAFETFDDITATFSRLGILAQTEPVVLQ